LLALLFPLAVATGRPVAAGSDGQSIRSVAVATGLSWPLFVTSAPGDASRVFVLERPGRVRVIKDGALQAAPFLDVVSAVTMSAEGGLLGLAFHPDYAANGRFFVSYTRSKGSAQPLISVVAEYRVSANPDVADPAPVRTLLEILQPYSNHKGGWIGFGPHDGFLYLSFGDGGGDAIANSQDLTDNLLGKILRIDVNGDDFPGDDERNYAIPPDNPFVGVAGDDEILAYGVRNPYRCTFDRETGDLWIADVGDATYEEIDLVAAGTSGQNFGWGCMEGPGCSAHEWCACADPSLEAPVYWYEHPVNGCAVVGGPLYRGCAIPVLAGRTFFGDFCTAKIWSFRYAGGGASDLRDHTSELHPAGGITLSFIIGFGEDAAGEMYICDMDGDVFRISPIGAPAACVIPADLDGNGAVDFADLLLLLAAWGPCAPACPEDLDGSGAVNFADLLILLTSWT
jgi:glucose/arabinose dehydrogenase